MKIKFIETEGFALQAKVEVNGKIFAVMDEISFPDRAVKPNSIYEAEFTAMCIGNETWEEIFNGNPEKKKCLEQIEGWKYKAFGEITGVNPIIIDCGIITIEDDVINTHDERCMGEFISFEISRLGVIETT
jgi:hypothetical protein